MITFLTRLNSALSLAEGFCLSNCTKDVCRNWPLLADRHNQPPIKGAICLNRVHVFHSFYHEYLVISLNFRAIEKYRHKFKVKGLLEFLKEMVLKKNER